MTAGGTRVETTRPVRLRQLPGLDGLRAIAIVAVIVYHLEPSWLPGGYLGVDVFFVISGYLITSLLLSEHQRSGTVSLRRFWARRARRLLPALAVLLVVVTVLAACFARDALGPLQGDVPASVFYVLNWRLLFQHDSYVASFGRPPLLQHLWSLSVEEQFYLVWPPVLLLLRRRFSRSRIATMTLAGALLSATLMAVLFRRGDPSAVYFGTHTHAEGLLLGCALAAAIPPWRMTATVTPRARRLLERSGVVALVVVIAGLALFGFDSSLTYRGGMLLVDVATVVVIATVAHPASRLGAGLGRQPLRWLGLRSYSLYLWHWPIFELTRPGPDLSWPAFPDLLLRLALTAAAAELSYRYIEQPWRDGRAQFALRLRIATFSRYQVAGALAAPVALVAALLATAPGPSEPAILFQGSTAAARSAPTAPSVTTGSIRAAPPPRYIALAPPRYLALPAAAVQTAHQQVSPPTTAPAPPPATPLAASEPILAIGDSVMLAASPALQATFGPAITVDAAVGRRVDIGISRLSAYRASGALSHYRTVVVGLGTNGTFNTAEFNELAAVLAGVPHVVVFNVHAARSWALPDDRVIAAGVAAHRPQMTMVDWNTAAFARGVLYSDGIHPNAAGAALYTRLLLQALTAPSG